MGWVDMRHLDSNIDFSFFMMLVISTFQKSFASSKEAVHYSFMMGEYFHAQLADGETDIQGSTVQHFQKCLVLGGRHF